MIYINGRFLTRPMTGVERYAYNICKSLLSMGQTFTIICPKRPILDIYDTHDMNIVHFGHGNSHFWEQCMLPFFFVRKKNYLLLNFTGLGPILIRKKIMTIHDLSFLENSSWHSLPYRLWYKMMTPLAARTSRQLITVSNFSKNEILRFYPSLKKKEITIVYNAADKDLFHRTASEGTSTERFVLAVSSIDPRKNFIRLLEAFTELPTCRLNIVGKANRVFKQQNLQKQNSDNVKFLGKVSDQELVRLYNHAYCFVFPSIYEGFGIPPIEAMACGCPVLAADIPVLREVCSDGAIYFDPYNVQDICNTIKQFMQTEDNSRNQLIDKGLANASRFSWEVSAKKVLEIINNYTDATK